MNNIDKFKKEVDDDYTLYELKEDDNIYIEECNVNGYKKYLVHNHKTNQTYPIGKFYNTINSAINKALMIFNN
jgi:ssDNA-binding replication factor A large subunit